MKTSVQIADDLFAAAKQVATDEHTTVHALIEEGLRRIIEERQQRTIFRLRRASFRGQGLHSDVQEGSWERIRTLIYEGRGA